MARRSIIPAALAVVALVFPPPAHADDSDVLAYAANYGAIVCDVLDGHSSVGGVLGVIEGVQEHGGFTAFDAGRVVGLSVAEICPRHTALMRRFIAAYQGVAA